MLASLPDTLTGKRDRASLTRGFAGAFRRSELIALELADADELQCSPARRPVGIVSNHTFSNGIQTSAYLRQRVTIAPPAMMKIPPTTIGKVGAVLKTTRLMIWPTTKKVAT